MNMVENFNLSQEAFMRQILQTIAARVNLRLSGDANLDKQLLLMCLSHHKVTDAEFN